MSKHLFLPLAALALFIMGTSVAAAQTGPSGISPELQQRVEVMLRSKADFPPATTIGLSKGGPSDIPGFDKLDAHFSSAFAGESGNLSLLISKDGKQVAQFSSYDIAGDPRAKVPADGRPSRGGPGNAPVLIVGFDDLECPFCAKLNQELFPALTNRYKDEVRVVYQSFPSEGHPWAMRAAVDTDCLAHESSPAYWAAVDNLHAHASEYGGAGRKLTVAEQQVDAEATEQGHRFHLDEAKLQACIQKQDTAPEKASLVIGQNLGVTKTPTLFVNGAKFDGAVPITFVFDMVDNALRAEGMTPPPRDDHAQPVAALSPTQSR